MTRHLLTVGATLFIGAQVLAAEQARPASERFAAAQPTETPDFQRHVLPLMGRLGCNGRACHGSFQGQGGFRLSLFGYDFKADHDALLKGDNPRVDTADPEGSLIFEKATSAAQHKGGKRMDNDSWQFRVFLKWIEGGAKPAKPGQDFDKLVVTPGEILFAKPGETSTLRVIAHWSDGSTEDVTCLCRFRTNDESVAEISEAGVVTAKGKGDTHVVAFYDNGVAVTQVMQPVSDLVGPKYPSVPTPTKIDELVVAKLRKLGITPSELATDEEFLRRVSLDITGTLPAPDEIRSFVKDSSPNKRGRKIDELLTRPAYAAWWATKLCDVTGNTERNQADPAFRSEFARQWYEWIRHRLETNVPYDKIIAGIVQATSRRPGQTYEDYSKEMTSFVAKDSTNGITQFVARDSMPHYWTRRNMRTVNEKALNFAYSFLAVRLECAECHKHPFDQWTQQDFQQFTAFFADVQYGVAPDGQRRFREMQEELGLRGKNGNELRRAIADLAKEGKTVPWQELFVRPVPMQRARGKAAKPAKAQAMAARAVTPRLLGGEEVLREQYPDPRDALMQWLRDPGNPYFARAIVNRIWSNYFNVGIISPTDDQNLASPPSNQALLDYLSNGLIEHQFDLKWLHREIANSRTYQLSWKPNETNRLDERNFSRAVVRRIPAEVAYDAIAQATASKDQMKAMQRDVQGRAIAQAGTDQYRQRGQGSNFALTVFGKPDRSTICDCSRSNDATLLQSIYLRNDNDIYAAINRRDGYIADLAKSLGVASSAGPGNAAAPVGPGRKFAGAQPNNPARIDAERLARAQQRIAELRKEGKSEDAAKLQMKLDAARKQFASAQAQKARPEPQQPQKAAKNADNARGQANRNAPPAAAGAGPNKGTREWTRSIKEIIDEVYLRTVSRFPSAEEAARARKHFGDSRDVLSGSRDLLWVMLNTKEFIVNH